MSGFQAYVAKREAQEVEAAIKVIGSLCKEFDISLAELTAAFPNRPTSNLQVDAIVQWLKDQRDAKTATPPAAPQGVDLATYRQTPGKRAKAIRYALRDEDGTVKFYRVKPGYKPGVFFVDVQASDDTYPIKSSARKQAILDRIAKDPEAALALYGQEIGACGHCGRTLTSEYRKLGIGPVCINK